MPDTCRRCGTVAGPEAIYCGNCGTRLDSEPSPGPTLRDKVNQLTEQARDGLQQMKLDVVAVDGDSALLGVIGGLKLLDEGRLAQTQTPAQLFVFADALVIRAADSKPVSTFSLGGIELLAHHVGAPQALYRFGRMLHANANLRDKRPPDERRQISSLGLVKGDPHALRLPLPGIARCHVTRNTTRTLSLDVVSVGAHTTALRSLAPGVAAARHRAVVDLLLRALPVGSVVTTPLGANQSSPATAQ